VVLSAPAVTTARMAARAVRVFMRGPQEMRRSADGRA
jgi:hypothetical protein